MEPLDYSVFPERPVVYASFGTRLLAHIIDVVILFIVVLMINVFFHYHFLGRLSINLTIQWLYYASQESGVNMATIGKKVMNIKVTNDYGGRVTFRQATGRYFSKILSGLMLFLGYLMMLWDEKNQTLHDKIAGTFVVIDRIS